MTVCTHGDFTVLHTAQYMPYPSNAKRQAKERQVSILHVNDLTQPGFELLIFRTGSLRSSEWATTSGLRSSNSRPA